MINSFIFRINQSSHALSILLGGVILILLFYATIKGYEPFYVHSWAKSVLGYSFIFLILTLTFFSIVSILNICNPKINEKKIWFETGIQLSNIISTIALTYTLLGISLGIGELSSSNLNVDTINETISKLTKQFSMAFMTSVIGLPLSAALRGFLVVCNEYNKNKTKFIEKN